MRVAESNEIALLGFHTALSTVQLKYILGHDPVVTCANLHVYYSIIIVTLHVEFI